MVHFFLYCICGEVFLVDKKNLFLILFFQKISSWFWVGDGARYLNWPTYIFLRNMDNFVLIYTYKFEWHFHWHEYLINPGHRIGLFFTKLDYVPFLLIFHWNIFLVVPCFKLKQPFSKGWGKGDHMQLCQHLFKKKEQPSQCDSNLWIRF